MFRNIRAAVCLRAQEAEGRAVPGQPCEQNEGSEIDADPQDWLQLHSHASSVLASSSSQSYNPAVDRVIM